MAEAGVAKKIDALTARVKANDRVNPADRMQAMQAAKGAMPLVQSYNKEFALLEARALKMPPSSVEKLNVGRRAYMKSMETFTLAGAAKGL